MAIGRQTEQHQQPPPFSPTAKLTKIEWEDKIGQDEAGWGGGNQWIILPPCFTEEKWQNDMGTIIPAATLGGVQTHLKTNFVFNLHWLKKCAAMDQIVLSSSSDADDGTPLLDNDAEKQLEGELDLAEKLMHELQADDGEKKGKKQRAGKSAADNNKKLKVKNGGVKKAATKKKEESTPKKQQKKVVKKEKASPAKKPKIESSDDDDVDINSVLDESSTDQELVPTSTMKLAKKDKMKKEKAAMAADKFSWIKSGGHLPNGFIQLGQCSECGDAQKELDEVVGEDHQGLFCRIVQCKECLMANRKIRSLQQKLVSGTEKTPQGNFEFISEADDYKTACLVYCRQLGQCNYCQRKQHKIEPAYEKIGHGNVALKLAVCSLCVFMNKSLQKLYWDAFSSWNKKGKRGGKKNTKKRGRIFESSSDEEDSSEDEPPKKKQAPSKKAKGGKKTKKMETDDESDD